MLNWKHIGYFVPAVAWAVLIWSLSTTTSLPPIPWDFLSPDKIGHLIFYAIETLLLIWGFSKSQKWVKHKKIEVLICMTIAGSYGMALEFVQAGIPGRSFDYADMIANFIGTILGAIVFYNLAYKYFLLESSDT